MAFEIERPAYAAMFGPTTGDKVRLADTELFLEVEEDRTVYGEEVKFGGGKVIRDGMGQSQVTRAGGEPIMWKAGHSLIRTKLKEIDAPLAGEMSGHIFFADGYYGFDDALYAAVRLLAILCGGADSLAQMRDALPVMFNTPELRFDCAEDKKFAVIEEIKGRLKDASGITIRDIDGVRVETPDGWWLLRASNTQAILVARFESASEEGLGRLKAIVADQLRRSGLEPPDFG